MNDLSFIVQNAPWQVTKYTENVSQDVTAYDHSSAALGGFWSANVTLQLPLYMLEEWGQNGVGRQLTVYGRATSIVWEGIINRLSYNVGGYDMTVGPFTDIANKVQVSYSIFIQLSEGNMTGIRATSDYLQDTISQAKFGVLTRNFSAGGIEVESVPDVQAMLLERYKSLPRTENLTQPADNNRQHFEVKLECIGFAQMFQKYLYNSSTTGLQNLSTKLAAIVAAEPNSLFLVPQISLNTLQVAAFENNDNEAWGLIKSLIVMGDASLARYTFGCYENRQIVYKPVANQIVYVRPLREGPNTIAGPQSGLLQPWEVRPGVYILVSDFTTGEPLATNLEDDNRVIFADTVQYRHPDNLIINGAHAFRIEQKMAQLGISGIS